MPPEHAPLTTPAGRGEAARRPPISEPRTVGVGDARTVAFLQRAAGNAAVRSILPAWPVVQRDGPTGRVSANLPGLGSLPELDELAARWLAHPDGPRVAGFLLIDVFDPKHVDEGLGFHAYLGALRRVAEHVLAGRDAENVVQRRNSFVVVLPSNGLDGAELTAQQIRRAIADDPRCVLAVAIGVSAGPLTDVPAALAQAFRDPRRHGPPGPRSDKSAELVIAIDNDGGRQHQAVGQAGAVTMARTRATAKEVTAVRRGGRRHGPGPGRIGVLGAVGVGALAGAFAAAIAALQHQGSTTARLVEQAALEAAAAQGLLPPGLPLSAAGLPVPDGDGLYPAPHRTGPVRPLTLVMLGDSTSVGYGCRTVAELPGVGLARRTARDLNRPVRLVSVGLVGCGAADLTRQVRLALTARVDVAVINIGANDIRDKVPPWQSADLLGDAVAALRAQRVPVVVGSCPDFGVIPSIPQPLRLVLSAWSHRLAHLQERAAAGSGAVVVPLGQLISPAFAGHRELFAADGFHPSAAGYARAVDALAPAVLRALQAR